MTYYNDLTILVENGFCVDAPRDSGYSRKGEKCYACKDWYAKGRINAIEAIVDQCYIFYSCAIHFPPK